MARISEKQMEILDGMNVAYNERMSGYYAYKLIERKNAELKKERAKNRVLATEKQKEFMTELDIEHDDQTTSGQAWRAINETKERLLKLRDEIDDRNNTTLFDLANADVSKWTSDTPSHAKGPCPMPGCGGYDFWVNKTENVGGCNKCSWFDQDKNGAGAIGYYCAKNGVKWYEAVMAIEGGVTIASVKSEKVKTPKISHDEFRREWSDRLVWSQQFFARSVSATYLLERGIRLETANLFGCGHDPRGYGIYKVRECVLFPYFDTDGLCAINRRLSGRCKKDEKGKAIDKCRFSKGSQKSNAYFGVLGWSGFTWVVDGEINAMSLWQALQKSGRSDSVFSLSSEGDIRSRASEMRDKFGENLIVWCDKKVIADHVRCQSVLAWSTKQDANELLLAGNLESCITWMLNKFRPIMQDIVTIDDAIEYKNFVRAKQMLVEIEDTQERRAADKRLYAAKKEYNAQLNERLRLEK